MNSRNLSYEIQDEKVGDKVHQGKSRALKVRPLDSKRLYSLGRGRKSMDKEKVIEALAKGIVISCQALEDEPLHSSFIMGRMALAAQEAGAVGIRANSIEDIQEIQKEVKLPIIGIIKKDYENSNVYITATTKEVEALLEIGVEIIAMDATKQERPEGNSLEGLVRFVREKSDSVLLMADISTFEEAKRAAELGFDFIGTTLCGYTSYTKGQEIPNFNLIQKIKEELDVKLIVEGGIWETSQLEKILEFHPFSVVIGSAITRPQKIAKRFVDIYKEKEG